MKGAKKRCSRIVFCLIVIFFAHRARRAGRTAPLFAVVAIWTAHTFLAFYLGSDKICRGGADDDHDNNDYNYIFHLFMLF